MHNHLHGSGREEAVLVMVELDGMTAADYDALTASMSAMHGGDGSGHPAVAHIAAVTDTGLVAVDVWGSEEEFAKFGQEELAPRVGDKMAQMHPRFARVHNRVAVKEPASQLTAWSYVKPTRRFSAFDPRAAARSAGRLRQRHPRESRRCRLRRHAPKRPYVLGGMANRGGSAATPIRQLGVTKQAASQLIDTWSCAVPRAPGRPGGSARMLIELTERGHAAAEAVAPRSAISDAALAGMLTPAELAGRWRRLALTEIRDAAPA